MTQSSQLKNKHSKCEFFKTKVHYLGFLVGINGVQPLPEKVTAIQDLLPPKDVDELGKLLGLVTFYRKFIPFFTDINVCLNKMLRKGATLNWTQQCENTFKLLKKEFTKMPALQFPNPNKPFQLFTDVSKYSHSRILHQKKEGQSNADDPVLIPITYFSGTFNKMQQLQNTTQKECNVVYRLVQKFTFYLTGTECTLYCDHKPIMPFFTTGMSSHV